MRAPFLLALCLASSLPACSGTAKHTALLPGAGPSDAAMDALAETFYWQEFDFAPADAVDLGYHQYDGRLPVHTPAALNAEIARLTKARTDFSAFPASELSPRARLDRDVILYRIAGDLFTLTTLDAYHKNPIIYSSALNLAPYIVRAYAPLADRARPIIGVCHAAAGYLAQARANLPAEMPRTWLDIALLQTRGAIDFANTDVRRAFDALPAADKAELDGALDECVAAFSEHAAWLDHRLDKANDDFALGESTFLAMLADTQGVHIDLAELEKIAWADLDRNTRAIDEAARAIDPSKTTREVVLAAAAEKPAPDQVLAVATKQAADLRQFIIDHDVVTIPSPDVAEVRESPPFERWNAAFLDGAGTFETKALPSYYYISPPDPKWPAAEQLAYIPPTNDLLFITVHELWPGHFLHHLHIHRNASRVLKSYCTYSMTEGWAHYAEEMMFDAGVGGHDPKARIGMLKEALLRNVRFVVAIGEHTHGMTVDEATKLFEERAFTDHGNARQQAVRGTFDPMFLSYTVGKLMIMKLRADYQAAHPADYSLGRFHDAFLSYGCAPIPLIRRELLGRLGPAL